MQKGLITLLLLITIQVCHAQFKLQSGQPITIAVDQAEKSVVKTALQLFSRDYQVVFSAAANKNSKQGNIIIGTIGQSTLPQLTYVDTSFLNRKKQAFFLTV